ncbi:DUF2407 C-terminal domain-containing protein [Tricharina praecox]|uniref:DUF2407 C-terminal domain-containing protein n=1 Tax=Tricharina praecox TaxID=43433 RepID=UPI00221F4978|nr:DUF2407 C-terminal domain-containing protein [Tricharina praecox]KAI5842706.1 DUF2407 C-terminal domain-containing protein [Tricharina praecox]
MSVLPTHNPPVASSSSSAASAVLTLTIRFTTGDGDLILPLPAPQSSTTHTIKQHIRQSRPTLSSRKLRLIHAGKVLPDGPALSTLLPHNNPSIFIHCSVGEPLSPDELATEESPLIPPEGLGAEASYTQQQQQQQQQQSTLPAQLGFDRLLTQGFSEGEVAALRAQFARLNPDVDVNGAEDVRALEDRWIDESVGQGQEVVGGAGGGAGTYEDMLLGTAIGFFWPATIWLAREEGVFTQRRRYAVFAGLCVNLFFGVVRVFG